MTWRIPEYANSGVFVEDAWYDEPKRARRIRDKLRMKARARRIFTKFRETHIDSWRSNDDRLRWMKACEHLADNLQHCSKPCCNKPRFWEGPPFPRLSQAGGCQPFIQACRSGKRVLAAVVHRSWSPNEEANIKQLGWRLSPPETHVRGT